MTAVSNSPSYEAYRSTRIFSSLDGLRCMSILAVIWHHAGPAPGSWPPALGNGFLGVDLFFAISGFLIVTLLLRERDRNGELALGRFYARRALRIFPPYYGLLLALTIVLLTVGRGSNMRAPFFNELPFYLTYTCNWITTSTLLGISWSLAAEEQFYLLWPPIERFARRLIVPVLLVLLVVNQALNFRLLDGWLEATFGFRYEELQILQATFTPILLGVAVAHTLHDPQGFARLQRILGHRLAAPAILFLLVLLCNIPGSLSGWPRLSIQCAMAGLVAACVIREDHPLQPLLSWRPIARIGAISYGMYLFHLIALHPVDIVLRKAEITNGVLRFVACTGLTVVIAELSFRFYEQPFLRLKRAFSSEGQAARG